MSKSTAHVTLRPGTGTVAVNGVELAGVRKATIVGEVNCLPRLNVELVLRAAEVEVDGRMIVTILPETAATLAALGWTPPVGQAIDSPVLPHAYRCHCGGLVEGIPGDGRFRDCPHCHWDLKPEEAGTRYVLVQIGGAPDAASG